MDESQGEVNVAGSFPPGAVRSAANWASMPLVFGILAFVYSGHGVFPSVRASMEQPEDFPKVSFYRQGSSAEYIMHDCDAESTMHVHVALGLSFVIPMGW